MEHVNRELYMYLGRIEDSQFEIPYRTLYGRPKPHTLPLMVGWSSTTAEALICSSLRVLSGELQRRFGVVI